MAAKSLPTEEKTRVTEIVRSVVFSEFQGSRSDAAAELGCSQPHVSNMLSGKTNAGTGVLLNLLRFRPVEMLQVLGIKLETVIALWSKQGGDMGAVELPPPLRRAARAAMELYGYSADEVVDAAHRALADWEGDIGGREPLVLLGAVAERVKGPKRKRSGTRLKSV